MEECFACPSAPKSSFYPRPVPFDLLFQVRYVHSENIGDLAEPFLGPSFPMHKIKHIDWRHPHPAGNLRKI